MNKSRLLGAERRCLTVVSFNANAVIYNTLNGIDYAWLELTETYYMSRQQVEARLAARCLDLRDSGYNIVTTITNRNGKRYATYTLGVSK